MCSYQFPCDLFVSSVAMSLYFDYITIAGLCKSAFHETFDFFTNNLPLTRPQSFHGVITSAYIINVRAQNNNCSTTVLYNKIAFLSIFSFDFDGVFCYICYW